MKLSEAIRLGAMLRPQGTGVLFAQGRSCAFGAALEAVGVTVVEFADAHDFGDKSPGNLWPWLKTTEVCHPETGRLGRAGDIVVSLNNRHGWTREQIAEWVASQEAVAEPEAVAAVRLSVEQPVVSIRG